MSSRASSIKVGGIQYEARLKQRDKAAINLTITPRTVIIGVIAMALLICCVITTLKLTDIINKIDEQRMEITALKNKQREYKEKITILTSAENLKKIGKALRLHPPKSSDTVHIGY